MSATHARVMAALERREPDRVPTMDMMFEYAKIYGILGKRPLPLGWLFENKYTSKALDHLGGNERIVPPDSHAEGLCPP